MHIQFTKVIRFSRSVQRLVTRNIAFWTHFATSSDKAKWQRQNCLQETVGMNLQFSIFLVYLVRMLHSSFGVNMIQMTKCGQEDKVWLTVVVF